MHNHDHNHHHGHINLRGRKLIVTIILNFLITIAQSLWWVEQNPIQNPDTGLDTPNSMATAKMAEMQ